MSTKTVLITGGRSFVALDLARIFSIAGYRVVVVDSMSHSLCRYSSAVEKFFKVAPPAFDFDKFVNDLNRIILEEGVDLVVPTCEEVLYLGKAKPLLKADVFCENFPILDELHNKLHFAHLLERFSLPHPETHLPEERTTPQGKWILKPIYSRFASKVKIIEDERYKGDQSPANPLIEQAYIEGVKLCSYSVCQQGVVVAHSAYRVLQTMGIGSAVCFESIRDPEVDQFVEKIVGELRFTGQISFDFIRGDRLYCLECNPRATSGVHLFEQNGELAHQFFRKEGKVCPPSEGQICLEHLFSLWYGAWQKELFQKRFWSNFFKGRNPLWRRGDFRVVGGMFLMLLEATFLCRKHKKGFHEVMSRDLEYNGEGR